MRMINLILKKYFEKTFNCRSLFLVFALSLLIMLPPFVKIETSGWYDFIPAAGASYAAEIKIKAAADKTNASLGEEIILTITVSSDGRGGNLEPKIPDFEGFQIQGTRTSSQISIINGIQSVQMSYIYSIYPVKKGKLTIGEFSIEYADASGKTVIAKTQPIIIEVSEEKKSEPAPDSAADAKTDAKPSADAGSGDNSEGLSGYLFVITIIIFLIFLSVWFIAWQSKRKAYLAEKIRNQMNMNSGKLQINNGASNAAGAAGTEKNPVFSFKKNEFQSGADMKKDSEPVRSLDGRASKPAVSVDDIFNISMGSLKKGDYRAGCSECSRFFKIIFENMAGEKLTDLTTPEFIAKLELKRVNPATVSNLQSALEICDMVNYARYQPTESEIGYLRQEIEKTYNNFRRGV